MNPKLPLRCSALSLALLTLSEAPLLLAAGTGGTGGVRFGGRGGDGNGQGGGGGYYDNFYNGSNGSLTSGGTGGNGYVPAPSSAPGGAGGNAGLILTTNRTISTNTAGVSGGSGTANNPGGGGGGGGGAGIAINIANGLTVTISSGITVNGGSGGRGGDGVAGGGGGGGAGLIAQTNDTSITVSSGAALTGGNGGAGGNTPFATYGAGGGGGAGDGLNVQGNGNLIRINGSVTGGLGGTGGVGTGPTSENGSAGQGGTGIVVNGSSNQLVIAGSITGGLGGGSLGRANAVTLSGGNNRLELQNGYAFTGNVVSSGSNNTLALGGTSAASLDVSTIGSQLQGFSTFEKTDTSTWTLTGTTSTNRTWSVLGGTLIGSTSSLGSGSVVNNASLVLNETGAATYTGIISGSGSLSKTGTGTLTLANVNTYTGGTTLSAGTLRLGAANALGSGALIVNGGALDLNGFNQTSSGLSGSGGTLALGTANLSVSQNVDTTFGGIISGVGSLSKSGSGTLTLTGNQTFTGTTTVSAGTLQIGAGGTTGSLAGNVINNATLIIDRANDIVFSGVISGNGQSIKAGAGTWVLTNDNTYTGGTTISAGTLQVGNGGTSGSLVGDITNNASLRFLRSDDISYSGAISGTGQVRQDGSGTLTLTGDQSYTGGTRISAGTLQIGDGGTSGSLTGNIDNLATLRFNRSDSSTFSGIVSGTGSLVQAGSGTLVLTGANTYSGGTMVANGTLQIGNGGTTGSLLGDIDNLATLRFERSDTVTYAGNISGAGQTIQAGSGTLVLTGTHTYSGGTTITGGTLQLGNGGTTGSVSGNILNNGALHFNHANDIAYLGSVSGSGGLAQIGTGILTLGSDNSYSGGTVISSGTLIGAAGSFGNGAIVNDARLVIDQALDASLSNGISGGGTLTKIGNGNLLLMGTNTYSGGTAISAGTLSGSTGSFGSGAIVNDASLVIIENGSAFFSNALSGSGSLTKSGTGKLVLNGNASAGSGTSVNAGSLIVGGSAGSTATLISDVSVASGAMLGGHGRISGNVALLSGARLNPGNSIGTLTVNGNVSLASGSTLEIEVEPDGSSDQLVVNGNLDLGGSNLSVIAGSGDWSNSTDYTIITSSNPIIGTFGSVISNLAFLTPLVDYSLINAVRLTFQRNDVKFASVATTYNQRSTASAVESLGVGSVYNAISTLDASAARDAFDRLSGELHASLQKSLVDDSRHLRDSINSRMLAAIHGAASDGTELNPGSEGPTFWLKGYGSQARSEGDGNASGLDHDSRGTLFGADFALDDTWRLGAAVGQGSGDVNDGQRGRANLDNRSIALYGSGQWDALTLRLGATHTWHDIDTRRDVQVGSLNQRNRASYAATTTQLFSELGYRLNAGAYEIEPFVGLAHAMVDAEPVREKGGSTALASRGEKQSVTYSTLGLRTDLPFGELAGYPVSLQSGLSWQHAFGRQTPSRRMSLASGDGFDIRGVPVERDSAAVNFGLQTRVSEGLSLNLGYEGRFGEDVRDNVLRLGLDAAF